MLHIPSYNMGLAAGITAKAAGVPRPQNKLADIPGFEKILEASDKLALFFPSSYIEGFVNAYDHSGWKFVEWGKVAT